MQEGESMVVAAIRSFFVAFCSVLGIAASIFVVLFFVGGFGSGNKIVEREFNERIEPNAAGSLEVLRTAPVVLELKINDVIGVGRLTSERVRDILAASRRDDRVQAILLSINSPGGSAFDSDEIYRLIMDYKKQYGVPVYAYVDGLCASGGMMIACAADKICASDSSLVGSVGVVSQFVNATDLLQKIGVSPLSITAGKYKDDMNPLRPWTEGEQERMQGIIDHFYERFLQIVVGARKKITKQQLVDVYGAQVFPADIALEYGYIDQTHTSRQEVLSGLVAAAKIQGEVQVLSLQEERFFGGLISEESALLTGKVTHTMETPIPMELLNRPLYLYLP